MPEFLVSGRGLRSVCGKCSPYTAMSRTCGPQSLVMSSMSEVSITTGLCWAMAVTATAASMAYLWPWMPASIRRARLLQLTSFYG